MEFILKMSWDIVKAESSEDSPGQLFTQSVWIDGITRVQKLDGDFYQTWEDVEERHGSITHYATLDSRPPVDAADPSLWGKLDDPKWLTLLVYWTGDNDSHAQTVLVERAWLLAANGDTIERVAP